MSRGIELERSDGDPTVQAGRFDPLPLITHRFALDDIVAAYDLFSNRRNGVLKVAIHP
jgi:alcohol dehydrogenase